MPEPWRATTAFAMWNSETPPVVNVLGAVWLALTSIGVALPSAVTVCGSAPGAAVRPSPR